MSISSIASVATAAIAALLSVIMFFQGSSSLTLQTELQKRTQEIQTQQQEVQLQQQELQKRQNTVDTAKQLAQQQGPQAIASLKVAGMRRSNAKIFALLAKYGVQITDKDKEDIKKLLEILNNSKKLKVVGVGTHLMSSEDLADPQGHSRQQLGQFEQLLKEMSSLPFSQLHAYNSSGAAQAMQLGDFQKQHAYGLRIGLGLYGLLACDGSLQTKLSPVMSLKSKIVAIQQVKKNQAVSYGATWTAPRDSQIGIVPIGYADGVPTQLSNRGIVHVGEHSVSIVGRVCMDYTMVDVTDCVNAIDQEVVFFGKKQKATQVAVQASTIGYDVLTRISERVPRLFVNERV